MNDAAVTTATAEAAQGEPRRPDELALRLSAIVGTLETQATHRENLRTAVEDRWLVDIEQYHGQYDAKTVEKLRAKGRSEIFANLTRPKTNTVEAKLFDMLFPTDDKNWDIKPSPVPELTDQSRSLVEEMARVKEQVREQGGEATPQQDTVLAQAKAQAARLQQEMAEAARKAKAMMAVMDDQLTQCQYAAEARDVIQDGCRVGTGIMKGPIITGHERKRWYHQTDAGYQMKGRDRPEPVFRRVDPWSFYPDPDARTIEESEGVFERHMMNKKALRWLAHQDGFDQDAVRRVLAAEPKHSTPNPIVQLRSIIGSHTDTSMKRYHVWEYHGPMEWEDVRDLVMAMQGDAAPEILADFEGMAADKLTEIHVTAWFCQGEMLYFGPYSLDSNEPLYSVWCYERDESSVFGFGVPYLMRDPQKAVNGGWRMMLDNAGVAAGPQVVVDAKNVEPADGSGDYSLSPMKVWLRKEGMPGSRPFETFDIPVHQMEMAQIIDIAMRFIDQETNVPQMAAGEQGEGVTKTLGGMALLMNSTNVLFRRAVKNWDDDMTTPSHRRLYDWNMQFHQREDIKGDYEIEARGTSVLLVREIESQNLMAIVMHFSAHPVVGPLMKVAPTFRRLVQTMMIPADEVVKTDEELEEEAIRAQENPPEPNPDVLKAEVQMNIAEMERDTKLMVAQYERETTMMKLAEERNMTIDELQAMLEKTRMSSDSDERQMAVEAALTAKEGPSGGGHF